MWDKQAKDWNNLWLRLHEDAGAVTAESVSRLRAYDPADMEGDVPRCEKALLAAKREVESGEDVAQEGTT